MFSEISKASFQKGFLDVNPIITQRFGADPYALVYGDEVYFYMTADTLDYNGTTLKDNGYGLIDTISVVSTKDMVNFTDHGEIKVAGKDGAAKWARNSWAPAAAWKNIDGQDKFFLYFADSGSGIGVLVADSPAGPFTDPLGHGLITRQTPTCDKVLWLFDPAVLVDDDGSAYIYCGGGVPEGKASAPGTARVAKLGDDMISLATDPVAIDVPYLFEDSGIHKYNNKYYYTYCTNFSVDQAGKDKYGFDNGEIAVLVSDSPMGPFTYQERILKNPGSVFGLSGNNHHAVFNFKDQWYITYHTRVLEEKLGIANGYRCTFVTPFTMGEDGKIGSIFMDLGTRDQIAYVDPYEEVNATTASLLAGLTTSNAGLEAGVWCLSNITEGSFVKVSGVDFGTGGASTITVKAAAASDRETGKATILPLINKKEAKGSAVIQVRLDNFAGDILGYVDIEDVIKNGGSFESVTAVLSKKPTGVHDLVFVFSGEGYEILSWQFER